MADPHAPSSSLEDVGAANPSDDGALMLTPKLTASREIHPLKCCCGSIECVLLRHNCSVLDGVEKDVYTAARMGQVRCNVSYQNHERAQKQTAPRLLSVRLSQHGFPSLAIFGVATLHRHKRASASAAAQLCCRVCMFDAPSYLASHLTFHMSD
jgi:hypothetical protein